MGIELIGLVLGLAMVVPVAAIGGPAQRLSIYHDLPYTHHDEARQTLDVYAPEDVLDDHPGGAPVVVFVHGGGLLFGDKALAAHVGQRLTAAEIVAVTPNHRFSPAVGHPAHVEDGAAAVAWTRKYIARYGGDPERIVLAGHSSGGYLVALLGTDRRWLAAAGMDRDQLRGVVPISGFFHVERLAPERPKSVWGEDAATWRDASPAEHVDPKIPPTLLLYADGDDDARKAENIDFAAALEAQGVGHVAISEIPRRDHRSIFHTLNLPNDLTMAALIEFVHVHATARVPAGD